MKLSTLNFQLSTITVALIWATVMLFSNTSCSGNKKEFEGLAGEDITPDMRTTGVTTFISDSGIIRYKIITAEWLVYNSVDSPYWAFKKGIYLEKFDTLFRIDSSIKADTAFYYEPTKTWELRSNVHIRSQRGDKFDTELLFWNQKTETMYSDKFIRIEQPDKIIEGYGFESNQQMTEYQIFNNTGIFEVEDTAPATQPTSETPTDTIASPTDTIASPTKPAEPSTESAGPEGPTTEPITEPTETTAPPSTETVPPPPTETAPPPTETALPPTETVAPPTEMVPPPIEKLPETQTPHDM